MKPFARYLSAAIAFALLAGCAAPRRSADRLGPMDVPGLSAAETAAADASARLFDSQDVLRAGIEKSPPASELQQLALLANDPLARKTVSISMQDARAGQLLWILATEFGISLSVDPSVLELPLLVNLHLQKVTGRQALDHILSIFDVAGKLGPDNVLAVTLMEERLFDIETLSGKTAIDMGAGGDLFGSGGKNSGSLKDNLTMTGEFGEKADSMDGLLKNVEAIIADGQGASTTTKERDRTRFTLDRGGGVLYVRARPSKVQSIQKLLQQGKDFRKRQVQIDAQLIDVGLSDDSQLGIDWTLLSNHLVGRLGADAATLGGISAPLSGGGILNSRFVNIPSQIVGVAAGTGGGIAIRNNTFSAALNALRMFGTVRILSNPTVRVRNGTPAYLSVGNNIRYIQKITSNTTNTGAGSTTSTDVQTDSLFSGVVVGVSALVKADGFIELFVRPSQTQVQEKSLIPYDVGSGNRVTLPIVNTKSIMTNLNIRDGDTVIIGGLIDQQMGSTDNGIPGLSDIPGVGRAFNSMGRQHSTRELVVVLRARTL